MQRFITDELVMQQDYLWFLAGLSLLVALVACLRPAGQQRHFIWVGWVLGGSLAMTLAELIRIAQAERPPQFGPPNLGLDLLHGVILAIQVWGIWRPAGRKLLGALLLLSLLVLAGLRHPYPWGVTVGLVLAATAGVFRRGWQEQDPVGRKLAWLLVPALWLSPIGPATTALNDWIINRWSGVIVTGAPREEGMTALTVGLRRWSTTGTWGVWTAGVWLIIGLLGLVLLTRRRWTGSERQELRRFIPLVAVWLVAGLALAAGLGWRTKRDFEISQKLRVNLAAKLLSPADLAAAFGPLYDPQLLPGGSGRGMATVSREFQRAVLPVRRQLSLIQEELPDDSFAFILIERNGLRLAGAVAASFSTRADRKLVLEPEPDFAQDIQTKFLPPYREVYGLVTQARAPLYFPDGKFLGWLALEFGPGEWLAGQTQARLQALAIVGLGFGIALMGLRQRLKNLVRDEALRAAEVARQADRTKTEFLARVSHELRTPIQSVLGYGELLQTTVQGEVARSRLAALRQHGLLMLRLVNDLLDLGALQTGRFHFSPKPTRLFELVQQTIESMRPRAEAKALAFHAAVTPAPAEWWLADGERLRQVVLNLVSNAIKFTDHGSIRVVFGAEDSGDLVLKVSDTGPGIEPGGEARLFQPFARLEGTAAKEGTGLGLVLAKALCESMGGGIALEPQARGTCFVARFRLPPAPPPPEFLLPFQHSLHGRSILVIDDNTLIRELFGTYLQELGADCAVAADGPAALKLAAARSYDAIVLDLALPGMSGTEVARQLRQVTPQVRIVGVSAHASAEDRAQALAAGMDVFLTKPVDLRVLVEEIENPQPAQPAVSPQLAGLTERLRAQFRAEAPVLEAALTAAVTEADWPAVGTKAHYLKNSADVLGLRELAAACRDLELAAGQQQQSAAELAAAACRVQLHAWR